MIARRRGAARGFTLLEVLITIIILAIGLLGLASLQSKMQVAQIESYQRAQAVLLLEDMVARINANRGQAPSYVTGTDNPVGYDPDSPDPEVCDDPPGFAQDLCEWTNALKGAAETSSDGALGGAMIGARGCVEQIQAPNNSPGICLPGIYRVTVVWQGLNRTSSPELLCGEGLYGNDENRRAISAQTIIGLNNCN